MLQADGIKKQIQGQQILNGIDVAVEKGEMIGLLGPNGSGKTTLLRILAGEEVPTAGRVTVAQKPLLAWSHRARARQIAVLPQEGLPSLPYTVAEVVAMGRYPHQQRWSAPTETDEKVVADAMRTMEVDGLQARTVEQLSGGERQRVALAKAMVQAPQLLLLDEPTTYLDIGHQVAVLTHIDQWRRRDQLAVIAVFHDLNLAAQHCDRLILINKGVVVHAGHAHDVLNSDVIEAVYGVKPYILPHPADGTPQLLLPSTLHSKKQPPNSVPLSSW
ncbi:heme ABC transporter ATP-binding protein [Mechercharimyces sp. CAU 1602]|uniref:heme ABC transporter ATP-binding protein n=1 Tax=Mechercharimyces sp. CAU 1602 TaxID=2973933 RepID=UPI002161C145|nr:heme ABC transporter ATP-binding protein [Mechercharimyces sp. CAU 1602]MCS1351974.1 heme ABC transporter ATP-binding protein [Mechercharimyces sp. CAU 1602]